MAYRSELIPDFLKARSPEGLRRLMLERNLKDGKQYNYFSIQQSNGYWFAWFYVDLTDNFTGKIEKIITEGKE